MTKDVQVMFVDNTKIAFKAIDFEGRPGVGVEVEVEDRRGMIVLDCDSARDIAQNLMKTAEISERESEPQGTC